MALPGANRIVHFARRIVQETTIRTEKLLPPPTKRVGVLPLTSSAFSEISKDGKFRIDGLSRSLKYSVSVSKDPSYSLELNGKDIKDITIKPGETKDLGDIQVKPME